MNLSYANFSNLPDLDTLYAAYQKNQASVSPDLACFFQGFDLARFSSPATAAISSSSQNSHDLNAWKLLCAYRSFGHLALNCNPLSLTPPPLPSCLELSSFGFSENDLQVQVPSFQLLEAPMCSLQEFVSACKKIYANRIGIEYTHIENQELRGWTQRAFEQESLFTVGSAEEFSLLDHLARAELFETFLHTKYTGQKRFSIEGCETLIPVLCTLLEHGSFCGVQEAVIGMAHRGRLNVLANILGKSYAQIFHEFEDYYISDGDGSGDVKYHKGFVGNFQLPSGEKLPVTLSANASHLESTDPIAEGIVRAKQDWMKDPAHVLPILIHGDAAVAGQGVVYETMQLSKLQGYETRGTIHVIVNNQIGFTTSPKDTRSTTYCSAIGKAFDSPIFHVNAEDPLACLVVAKLSAEIRQKFHCDVFIDLNGYRKYGHNEGDEPTFTHPLEYSIIRAKESIYTLFFKDLVKRGILTKEEVDKRHGEYKQVLEQAALAIPAKKEREVGQVGPMSFVHTQIAKQDLLRLAEALAVFPSGFTIHPKVGRLLKERLESLRGDESVPSVDWGGAETLAFASILSKEIPIRLSGQDVGRGTFSHRHAEITDQVSGKTYVSLNHLGGKQAPFYLYNSPLSEYAVLGFEFGYSITNLPTLVIWEAQFGDFSNTAQVAIDQYIASSEQKWGLTSNLTLLLPHGYEGQGPEHSSARMERFLQLSSQNNFRVINPTLPSQLFHVLRQQAFSPVQKPLICFTPKALLRHPLCLSSVDELTKGTFCEVLSDSRDKGSVTSILLCSGKIYYDLIQERERLKDTKTAIIRLEQLYPFPQEALVGALGAYRNIQRIAWVQEEPANMGAWQYIHPHLHSLLGSSTILKYVGRAASASTAAGSYTLHKQELHDLLTLAFG